MKTNKQIDKEDGVLKEGLAEDVSLDVHIRLNKTNKKGMMIIVTRTLLLNEMKILAMMKM